MVSLLCSCNVSSRWQQCKNFAFCGGWQELTFCLMACWLSIVIICWNFSLFPGVFDESFVVAVTALEFAVLTTIIASWSGPSYVVSFVYVVVF